MEGSCWRAEIFIVAEWAHASCSLFVRFCARVGSCKPRMIIYSHRWKTVWIKSRTSPHSLPHLFVLSFAYMRVAHACVRLTSISLFQSPPSPSPAAQAQTRAHTLTPPLAHISGEHAPFLVIVFFLPHCLHAVSCRVRMRMCVLCRKTETRLAEISQLMTIFSNKVWVCTGL